MKQNIEIINKHLQMTKEDIYKEFIKDVKELYRKLHNLKIICADNGILVKDIISNFLNKLGVTIFTLLSVHCADNTVATRS